MVIMMNLMEGVVMRVLTKRDLVQNQTNKVINSDLQTVLQGPVLGFSDTEFP